MNGALSKEQLEALHCWEADDQVAGRPEMTGFRRRLRYHQARWREANGHPIGSQPIAPKPDGKPARPVGSRLKLWCGSVTDVRALAASSAPAVTKFAPVSRA